MSQIENILLTGIPRSGTSLIVSLLSEPGHLCFSEPPWLKALRINSDNGAELSENLLNQINRLRAQIKQGTPIEMVFKKNSQQLPDNYFHRDNKKISNVRETKAVKLPENRMNDVFVIKANALFTANLAALCQQKNWQLTAIIRDPLSVIMSWRSVNIASSKGRLPKLEKYAESLRYIGLQTPLIKRQVLLIDWYFKQYLKIDPKQIIKYEDLVEAPEKCIHKALNINLVQHHQLQSKNDRPEYNTSEKSLILKTLKEHGHYYKHFYPEYQ